MVFLEFSPYLVERRYVPALLCYADTLNGLHREMYMACRVYRRNSDGTFTDLKNRDGELRIRCSITEDDLLILKLKSTYICKK